MDMRLAGTTNNMMTPPAGFGGSEVMGLTGDSTKTEKEKIERLSKEFESIFLNRMLVSMRSTIQKGELLSGGSAEEIFTGMLDEEMARQMAYRQSGGLSQALVEQLASSIKPDEATTAEQDKKETGETANQTTPRQHHEK